MHSTFLFDCGNVLLSFDREHLLDIYVGDDKKDRDLFWKYVFSDWYLQDEGVPSKEYLEMAKKNLPERLWEGASNVIMHWKEEMRPIPGMEDLVKKLKASGKRLILVSNMPDNFSYDHDDIEVFQYFDGLVFSFLIKKAKPHKDFFLYAINKYGLDPRDCLFVDDNQDNVNSASSLGLGTYLFDPNHPEAFVSFIEKTESI